MPNYVIESAQIVPLVSGDVLRFENTAIGLQVLASIPGSPVASISLGLPDQQSENFLAEMQKRGEIISFREEHVDYKPLGAVIHVSQNTMGEQFEVCGATDWWVEKVGSGAGQVMGIADTGAPPQAARDAYNLQGESVYGGEDSHGHATACSSIAGGAYGVLPALKFKWAQALPNGSGSETTVANAIRALADAGCDIINLSLGGSLSGLIDAAVAYAQAKGIPCGAAAGNSGPGAQIGSPARACMFVWGATTRDGRASASFSSGGNNWPEQTGAVPGENVGVAHLDGGYGVGSGTSFAAPMANAMALGETRR